ncbi:hypothetical protein LIER_03390 [Lithospermum erythrorhizon]|uniref:Uncharacterized protein n=1 Tax=Lithospermum erythrorhizon TaxID=34254 RepID=A0AAV3NTE4_LITER
MPNMVNYKAMTTGKDPLARVSKRKGVATSWDTSDASALAPVLKKSRRNANKAIPEDAPVVNEVLSETTNPPSPDLAPVITFNIPDHIPSFDIMASVQESPPLAPPPVASSSSGCTSLEYPYFVPSGITVTEKTVSKREEPTVSLLLKGDMEGIMGYSSPSELHDAFSHFQLKSTECAHGLFLKWKESEESRAAFEADKISLEKCLSEVIKERDEARAQDADLKNKHANLQAVCNGLVKSKTDLSSQHEIDMDIFKSSLEEAELRSRDLKAQLDSSRELVEVK